MSSIIIKKLLLPFLFLLVSFAATAQHSVTGKVLDTSGNPVPFANVLLKSGTEIIKTSSTAESGEFEIADVANGSYELVVSTIGFKEYSKGITVSGNLAVVGISLEEEPL